MALRAQHAVVVGGGPAGLVSAVALRRRGLRVTLVEACRPPIDKACGEGLMPDGVRILLDLGMDVTRAPHAKFHGIRFLDGDVSVESRFPSGPDACAGIGLRRTELHTLLVEAAGNAGVELLWGEPVTGISSSTVSLRDRNISADWIIGADGQQSRVRGWAGLDVGRSSLRFGFRRHFSLSPWSNMVEVYWCPDGQIYVSPVAANQVCVAWVSQTPQVTLQQLLSHAASLAGHLRDAPEVHSQRGAATRMMRLHRVSANNVALVGEASGSVDAITGEGMALAFRQAMVLADAIASGNLTGYDRAHRRIMRHSRMMANALLLMGRGKRLRRRSFQALMATPGSFNRLLEFHLTGDSRSLWHPSLAQLARHIVLP